MHVLMRSTRIKHGDNAKLAPRNFDTSTVTNSAAPFTRHQDSHLLSKQICYSQRCFATKRRLRVLNTYSRIKSMENQLGIKLDPGYTLFKTKWSATNKAWNYLNRLWIFVMVYFRKLVPISTIWLHVLKSFSSYFPVQWLLACFL